MKESKSSDIIFVNTVIGRGALNNVVNISFGAFNFSPNEQSGEIELDTTVACRLRMDIVCAKQLSNALIDLLNTIEKAQEPAGSEPVKNNGLVKERVKIN
jgi:hypothetical protein